MVRIFSWRAFCRSIGIGLLPVALSHCASQDASCSYPDVVAGSIVPVPPSLAYPEDGATNVPNDFGTVLYYYGTSDLPVRLTSGATGVVTTPGIVPSPLPSPIASPRYGGEPALSARPVPTLSPHTSYSIVYKYTSVSGCPMKTTTQYAQLGSFTTQ